MSRNQGNALFLILIAVALFAALSYAVTRTGRGGGGTERETRQLRANELLQHAASVADAVTRLKIVSGCSDTQISFQSPETGTTYENLSAPADESCHVFSRQGGSVPFLRPDTSLLDTSKSQPFSTRCCSLYRAQ